MTILPNHHSFTIKLFQRLVDIFHQECFESIRGERSKLRTYVIYKKETGFESYLSEIKNTSVRTKVSRFRLSNHKLMIEVGRYRGFGNRGERLWLFCPDRVEDESHFLLSRSIRVDQSESTTTPLKPQKVASIFSATNNTDIKKLPKTNCNEKENFEKINN